MSKQVLINSLTVALFPLGCLASIGIVAALFAMLIVCSPFILLGGALATGGQLAKKITEWLFPTSSKNIDNSAHWKAIPCLILLNFLLIPLAVVPVALAMAILPILIATILLPVFACLIAYTLAEKVANKIDSPLNSESEQNPKEIFDSSLEKYFPATGSPISNPKPTEESSPHSAPRRFFNGAINKMKQCLCKNEELSKTPSNLL